MWERQVLPVYANGLDDLAALTAGELHARHERERIRAALLADNFDTNPTAMLTGKFFYAPDTYTITPGRDDEEEDSEYEMKASASGHIIMPDGIHNLKIRKFLSLKDLGTAVMCCRTTTRTGRGFKDLVHGDCRSQSLIRILSLWDSQNRTDYQGGVGYWQPLVLADSKYPGHDESMLDLRIVIIQNTEYVKATKERLDLESETRLAAIYRYATQLGPYFDTKEHRVALPNFALSADHGNDRGRSRWPQDRRDNGNDHRSRSPWRSSRATEVRRPSSPLPATGSRNGVNRAEMASVNAQAAGHNQALGKSLPYDGTPRAAAPSAFRPPVIQAHVGRAPANARQDQAVQEVADRNPTTGALGQGKGKQRASDIGQPWDTRGVMTKMADQMQRTAKIVGESIQGDAGPSHTKSWKR